MPDIQTKLTELAQIIDGRVVPNQIAMKACVKGIVSGFPVTLEATQTNYPFGVSYFLETSHFSRPNNESFKLTILPKYARGWFSFVTRFLLDLSILDSTLIFKYDNGNLAKQFAHYPGVANNILLLEKLAHFSEMIIQSNTGLYLSQPTSFSELDLTVCKTVFDTMAKLGQVLFEAF